jgi:hypothetical protein
VVFTVPGVLAAVADVADDEKRMELKGNTEREIGTVSAPKTN